MARSSEAWLALRSSRFRLLAAGQLVSNVGDGMYAVALPWYVLSHGGTSVLLGVVLAAYGIPRTALIIVGGHLSDRFGPTRVMLGADISRMILVGALAIIASGARVSPIPLVAIAFGLGAGQGLFLPASFSVMPALVDGAQLQSGNALLASGTQLASFAGPALGGIVVAAAGSSAGFALDAASFFVSAATLWRLSAGVPATVGAAERNRAGSGARQATEHPSVWAFCRRERVFLLIIGVTVAANLGSAGTSEVALPVFARQNLHAGAAAYGTLVACLGVGSLVGSLTAARLSGGRRPAITAALSFLVQAPLIAGLALVVRLPLAAAMLASWGMLNGYGNVVMQTVFQRWAPRALLGRLSAVLLTASYGVFPISVALAGVVVRRFGPGAFFTAAGVLLALALIGALSRPSFRGFAAQTGEAAADGASTPGDSTPASPTASHRSDRA